LLNNGKKYERRKMAYFENDLGREITIVELKINVMVRKIPPKPEIKLYGKVVVIT